MTTPVSFLKRLYPQILRGVQYLSIIAVVSVCLHFLFQPKILGILIYLKQHTHTDGKYDYVYYPKENITGYSYNLIRHSATTYILASYLHDNSNLFAPLFNKQISQSLRYVLQYKSPCPALVEQQITCIVLPKDPPTLGANAFTIMALSSATTLYDFPSKQEESFTHEMISLEKFLTASFKNGALVFEKETTDTSKRYQEGQVLLAWSRLHSITGDKHYLKQATLLKNSIIKRLGASQDGTLHHWLWIGLREYHNTTKEPVTVEELNYLVRASEQLLLLQRTDPTDPLYGTFNKDKASVRPTDSTEQTDNPLDSSAFAVKIEALGALHDLLSFNTGYCDPEPLCNKLTQGIHNAAKPFSRGQINLVDILRGFTFSSFGGFPAIQKDSMIQIDYLQHALSAYETIDRFK